MAIQGHSFGGGVTNYLVTHTAFFAAAAEAAGPSDPISEYLTLVPTESSIEHYSQQLNYEMGKRRYQANPWQSPELYRKNSAVLNADKVKTPLLIMHNIKDNQVNFRQGVEMFMALRRLHKKVWLLQYDNGNHSVFGNDALDYTMRLMQFFNHYLKGTQAPKWMTEGVEAYKKGIATGFELDSSCKQP